MVGVWNKRAKIHAHINFVILNFTFKMNIMLLFAVSRNYTLWQSNESCVAVVLVLSEEELGVRSLNLISVHTVLSYTSRTKL